MQTPVELDVDVDTDVRALIMVIVRTLRFVCRWLERKYQL